MSLFSNLFKVFISHLTFEAIYSADPENDLVATEADSEGDGEAVHADSENALAEIYKGKSIDETVPVYLIKNIFEFVPLASRFKLCRVNKQWKTILDQSDEIKAYCQIMSLALKGLGIKAYNCYEFELGKVDLSKKVGYQVTFVTNVGVQAIKLNEIKADPQSSLTEHRFVLVDKMNKKVKNRGPSMGFDSYPLIYTWKVGIEIENIQQLSNREKEVVMLVQKQASIIIEKRNKDMLVKAKLL